MKRQTTTNRQDYTYSEPQEVKLNNLQQPIAEYINILKTQIRHIGAQIDFQFERSSEFIFSLYKHFYSPTQCPGQKATFLNKLSNCGVQWGLHSVFDQKTQELEGPSQQGRSNNQMAVETKEQENSKRAYNIRAKTRPQKHRYMEDEYDYGDRNQKIDGPRRGRPTARREPDVDPRRDTTNPYEKALYKKRRLPPEEQNQESIVRDEGGKSSAKWQQSEDDKQDQNQRLKENEEDRDENQKQAENVRTDKFTKQPDFENKSPAKIGAKGELAEGQVQRFSFLVQNYRKSWNFSRLILELEKNSDV